MTRTPRSLAAALGAAGVGAALLTACGSDELANSTWQITNVYTAEQKPSELPASIAGAAVLSFGGSSITGFTGCANLQGLVEFTSDDKPAQPGQADRLTVSELNVQEPDDSCQGQQRYVHDAVVDVLSHTPLEVQPLRNGSGDVDALLLREQTDAVNKPGLRLAVS